MFAPSQYPNNPHLPFNDTAVSQPTSSKPSLTELQHVKAVNHHLRIAADQVTEGIMILEPEPIFGSGPRIVYVNRALCRLTKRSMEELLGHSLALLFDPEKLANFLTRLPAVAEDGRKFHTIASLNCADGSKDEYRWTVRAVNDRFGRTLNYTVTLRREIAPEIFTVTASPQCDAQEIVHETADTPDEMIDKSRLDSLAVVAGGMAHDFNNLLQTMMGRFDLIRPGIKGNKTLETHFKEIEDAAKSARGLTTHLLAFAKGGDRERKLADVCDIICKAKTLSCIGSSVECDIEFDGEVHPAMVDDTQITQVLNNLIINGRQAMNNAGKIRVCAENIWISSDTDVDAPEGEYIRITVADRGCGIPQEDLENIFNPFFTTKKDGTGLGLVVTRAIVRSHGGDITVRSQVNVGTQFSVYLPASQWPETELENAESELCDEALSVKRYSGTVSGKILVIDDQEGVRSVASALIQSLGFEAVAAPSGEEGIRLYRDALMEHENFNAVLLDMTLPGGISGDETMVELRRIDPEARIIASSGALEQDAEIDFSAGGYTGVLPKPYTSEELKESLYDAIVALPI
ncbi:MAG: signal transduction histidine kinase/CheY-like chemotaxis protein [Verrucomicrobiales bacterium]|jgi:signal transduction histidine kinase/CheY-like chemotaxis protein